MDEDGWTASAPAWIAALGETGDWGRVHVLDSPMLARVEAVRPRRMLDVGCGEGRFCRVLRQWGIDAVGLDPALPLLEEARRRDPEGDYREGTAEALPFENGQFDLVVSYLSLIDITDFRAAIQEMARVLAPGGTLLVANLSGFVTAATGWTKTDKGKRVHSPMDRYLEERALDSEWDGIKIINHHRPLSAYMQAFLGAGLELVHFDEPPALGGDPDRLERYTRVPWFVIMEWRSPA